MQQLYRCLIVGILAFPFNATLIGQTPSADDAVRLKFDKAVQKHKRDLRDLVEIRGVGLSGVASADGFAKALELDYPSRTAVLLYSYDEGELCIFALYDRGVAAFAGRKVSLAEIAKVIRELQSAVQSKQVSSPKMFRVAEPIYRSNGADLTYSAKQTSELLIPKPIAEAIKTAQHLIIVPVHGIGTVPFALLKPFSSESELIDRMTISIAPSLFDIDQVLGGHWDGFESNESNLLIVGNPDFAGTTLKSLNGAEVEAKAIAQLFGVPAITGKQATKQNIKERLPKAGISYFATHGVADASNSLDSSYLALAALAMPTES